MSATFILTSRYPLSGTGLARFAAEAPDTPHRKHYVDLDRRELLQLRSYDSLAEFAAATAELDDDLARAARFSAARAVGSSREILNRLYYAQFRGSPLDRLVEQGRAWHRARFGAGESLFLAPVVAALEAHRAEGVAPVLVSGSMPPPVGAARGPARRRALPVHAPRHGCRGRPDRRDR